MKTIVITGAGKGIGHATALLAAKKGHRVIALSRNVSALQGIENIDPYSVDLAQQSSIKDVVLQLEKMTIDTLINNAGSLTNTPVLDSSFDLFEQIYKVNVFGLAELTRQLLPQISPQVPVLGFSFY